MLVSCFALKKFLKSALFNIRQIKKQAQTTSEEKEVDKVREFFLKLAGEDMEVDWMELKEILDYAMKSGGDC